MREEVVENIKLRAESWTPREVEDNHLRHIPAESIHKSMGHLGMSPMSPVTKQIGKAVGKASSFYHLISSAFGGHGQGFDDEDEPIYGGDDDVYDHRDRTKIPDDLPDNFSWREKMPECLGPIEDQGECGSCWAFSSSGLLADRFCIHTDGDIKTRFSP